jgi:hypothetical protein
MNKYSSGGFDIQGLSPIARPGRFLARSTSHSVAVRDGCTNIPFAAGGAQATELGLGGCALGIANIDLFAKMTGIAFYVEGPVGQFVLGRGATPSEQGQEADARRRCFE